MTIFDRLAFAASILRLRREDVQRLAREGGPPPSVAERQHAAIAEIRKLLTKLEREIG